MNLARKRVFFLIDLLILSLIILLTVSFFSPVSEPYLKQAVYVISFLIFIYTFDGYEVNRENEHNLLYTAILITIFSFAFSTLVNYVIFFKTLGRKVSLLAGGFTFFYLLIRYSVLLRFFSNIKKNIYVFGNAEKIGLIPGKIEKVNSVSDIKSLDYYDLIIIDNDIALTESDLRNLIALKLKGYKVLDLIDFHEYFLRKIPVKLIKDCKYFFNMGVYRHYDHFFKKLYIFGKRLLDIVASVLILILTCPIMVLTAIAIKLESEGGAIFKQVRTGLNGKPFVLYKFRSMRKDAEKDGAKWASENDSRVTKVGKFIRKTRIDELPQLFNVLKGDMSLIGPRPERPEFDQKLEREIPYYSLRYLVKPGLTGWAQVNYPYGASVEDAEQKLTYDLYYVKNASFLLDIEIALKTIKVIFFAKGR